MIANYHTHSHWCRHGEGEFEDFVKEAIRLGFVELAITEHVPHRQGFSWMPVEEIPLLDADLTRVKEKYSDQIHVIKGFECEYYPQDLDDYKRIQEMGYEFLILGQHACGENQKYNVFGKTNADAAYAYAEDVIKGLECGLFKMLAHPDVLMVEYENGWDRHVEEAMNQVYQAASELHIPVEINGNGLRAGKAYPSRDALLLSKKYDLIYLVNSDAHKPNQLYDEGVQKAEKLAKELGIQVTERFPF